MRQRRRSPVQERRRVRLARSWAVETGAEIHVSSGAPLSFILTKTPVSSKCISVMHRFEDRPSFACSPAFCLRQNISKVWAIENAGVLSLQPVIEPGNRLDVKTLPRPGEAVLAHHSDLHMLTVIQPLVGSKSVGQMQWHVLPVASEIDWYFDAI